MHINYDTLDYNCEKTWDLICNGYTKGGFQIESNLSRSWCQRVKPRSIEELAAVISIIRPGCLEAIVDGKSLTQHYCDRKNGKDLVTYYHPSLEPILNTTYGILIYQEQSLEIAKSLAGFSLQEADELRKGIGRKIPKVIAKIKDQFLSGCAKVGKVNHEEAVEIFSWIEKSQRYAFNKSHAIAYAVNAYVSMYCKAHNMLGFYRSYMNYAAEENKSTKDKKPHDIVGELVNEAKVFDIYVETPDITKLSLDFKEVEEKNIIIGGLRNIRSVGSTVIKNVKDLCPQNITEVTLNQWLFELFPKINSRAVSNFIKVGCFDYLGLSRSKLHFYYDNTQNLTNKELKWCCDNHQDRDIIIVLQDLARTKKDGGGVANVNRLAEVRNIIQNIKNPPFSLTDDITWLAETEKYLLGYSNYHKVLGCDRSKVTASCLEFIKQTVHEVVLGVSIKNLRTYKIKNKKSKNYGRYMAFLEVEDESCSIDDVVLFCDLYEENKHLLAIDSCVLLSGYRSENGGLIVRYLGEL